MASLDKKTKTWQGDITINGKRIRKKGFLSKKIAEIWEVQQQVKHERELVGLPVKDDIEIVKVIDRYLQYSQQYKRAKSYKREVSSLNHWLEFFRLYSLRFVHEIKEHHACEFVDWRKLMTCHRKKPLTNRTLNLDMEIIKRCFNWAVDHRIIARNVLKKMPMFKTKKAGLPRYLSLDEIEIIEQAAMANKRMTCFYEAFAILVRTGMRSGELCGLKIDNVDLERRQIVLQPDQTKNGQMRAIPCSDVVMDILCRLIDRAKKMKRKHLIYTKTGKSQTPCHIGRRMRNLLKNLGESGKIKKASEIHVHSLRRTFISHMIMAGAELVKVMAWVGHREWSTIRRYLVLSPSYIKEGSDLLPY